MQSRWVFIEQDDNEGIERDIDVGSDTEDERPENLPFSLNDSELDVPLADIVEKQRRLSASGLPQTNDDDDDGDGGHDSPRHPSMVLISVLGIAAALTLGYLFRN